MDSKSLGYARRIIGSYVRAHLSDVVLISIAALVAGAFCALSGAGTPAGIVVTLIVVIVGLFIIVHPLIRIYPFLRDLLTLSERGDALYISSVLDEPRYLTNKIFWEVITRLTHDARTEIGSLSEERKNQERYMELWVHEIKTPLAALSLLAGRLSEGERGSILGEVSRVESLVEQALYVARLESFHEDFMLERACVREIIHAACKLMARNMIEHGLAPQINVAEDLVVTTDKKQLNFILRQVIQNALQYGASHITFSAEVDAAGNYCVLSIADDGWGIEAADLARIFERGFTGKNGRAYGSSTGMGLYLCADICAGMGARIEAESDKGKGTVIRIVLPFDVDRFAFESAREGRLG